MAMVAGVIARWWARRPALLQVGGWLLAGALVWTTAVLVHPSPQTRLAGGEERAPSRPVHPQEGEVGGVPTDHRTGERFPGIPHDSRRVGGGKKVCRLRWL